MGIDIPLDGAFEIGGEGVRFEEITDGLSNTFLVGEKHVPLNHFGEGWLDSSTYNGDYPQVFCRAAGPNWPLAQTLRELSWSFGSYHPGLVQFAFCDGSVHALPVTTDPKILALLASRNDGQIIPEPF
jgi:prepilin-type processing-associated H-X9-DG protein